MKVGTHVVYSSAVAAKVLSSVTVITPPVVIETCASLISYVVPGVVVIAGAPAPSVPAIRVILTVRVAPQDALSTILSIRVKVIGVGIAVVTAAVLEYALPSTIAPPVLVLTGVDTPVTASAFK